MGGLFAALRLIFRVVRTLIAVALIVVPALALALYLQARAQPPWRAANNLEQESVQAILKQMGIAKPGWRTLIVAASQDTRLPRETLWTVWTDLEGWPAWSAPLVVSARWVGPPGWRAGAQFEQVLDLGPRGFPGEGFAPFARLVRTGGRVTSRENVVAATAGRSVAWRHDRRWLRSYHQRLFQDLAGGGTLVTDVEVLDGPLAGLLKPMVWRHWDDFFARSVAGLIRAASGGKAAGAASAAAG